MTCGNILTQGLTFGVSKLFFNGVDLPANFPTNLEQKEKESKIDPFN